MTTELLRPGPVPLWEVPFWRERFGVTAGITGRGADPATPFDLGLWADRPVGEVMGRWRAFSAALPQFPAQVLAHQVHGDNVLWHEPAPSGWRILEGADGHATAANSLLLLITVADCVPVYLCAPEHRAIALVHAGWRGTASGIVGRAVSLLKSHASVRSHELIMHCGVAISGSCYEVGNEVLAAMGKPGSMSGRSHLNLRDILMEQGKALGIGEISASTHCSASEREHFFSHRASAGTDGRMVAYLGIDP